MRRARALYAGLLAGSILLVSLRGSAVLWLLFHFTLAIPVLSLLYILYIYFRFRIGQQVSRRVNKGERVPYKLKLANDDLLLMTGIRLNFYTDTVHVMKKARDGTRIPYAQAPDTFSLLPHQYKDAELELYCKYRGTYPVGVKSVSVTDLFGLFTITYPVSETVRLTVRPRMIPLAQLQSKLEKRDPKKNRPAITHLQDILDFELRKYIPGDPLRHIHWKNSARAGELLVRRQAPQELYELVVIMDCTPCADKAPLERMQREDNIIETAVALLSDACKKKVRTRVVWCAGSVCEMRIDHPSDFEKFYNLCAELPFSASLTLEETWEACERKMCKNPAFVLIGCNVSPALAQKVEKRRRLGEDVVLIDTGEAPL